MGEINSTDKAALVTADKVKVSSGDTTPAKLNTKLVAGTSISIGITNPGANESSNIRSTASGVDTQVRVSATDTTSGYLSDKVKISTSAGPPGGLALSNGGTGPLSIGWDTSKFVSRFKPYTTEVIGWSLNVIPTATTQNPTVGGSGAADVITAASNTYMGCQGGPFNAQTVFGVGNPPGYLYTPDSRSYPTTAFTVWLWWTPTVMSSSCGPVVCKNYYTKSNGSQGYSMAGFGYVNSTRYFIGYKSTSGYVTSQIDYKSIPLAQWFLFCVGIDPSTGSIYGYVNGTLVSSYSAGTSKPIDIGQDGPWTIGRAIGYTIVHYSAATDFRLYNAIPTQAFQYDMYRRAKNPTKSMGYNRNDTF